MVRTALPLLGLLMAATAATAANPQVVIETSMGNVTVELYEDKAPISVKNFLGYVDDKFYDGTVFHRVIGAENSDRDFMIQGGGFTPDLKPKDTKDPIKNEATNGLTNDKYTLAMARTGVVDSATSQFFINVGSDNGFLNHRSPDPRGFGYCVFGKVVAGTEVVDKIKAVPTTTKPGFAKNPQTGKLVPTEYENCPKSDVVIKSVKRVEKK
jgi:cyclophilin family peptidyl-prolyl cis-trans isomerase